MSKAIDIHDQLSHGAAPLFMSGLSKSVGLAPDSNEKIDSSRKIKPDSAPGIQHRLEIPYAELKFGAKKGQGSYGEVFEGEYRRNKVAIKIYDFHGMLAEKQRLTLFHEADLMEGLRSDYLVGLRGICFDPRYCLVMEYCEGGTLRARLDDVQREIDPKQSLLWAQQISYGIYNLHSIRITHSDLKGENVLLDAKGHAKVADFGLSVLKSASASQSKRANGHVAGTLPWMAPELFNGEVNSTMTDVYSLGIILWEIASRRRPFADKMPAVIAAMVLAGKREVIDPTWAPVFNTMIQACWHADPKDRPTAEQVGDEFKGALASIEAVPQMLPLLPPNPYGAAAENSVPGGNGQSSIQLSEFSQLAKSESKESKFASSVSQGSISSLSSIAALDRKPESQKQAEEEKHLKWVADYQNRLIAACETGNLDAMKTAIQNGADPTQPNAQGKMAFPAAIYGMNQDIIDYLRSHLGNQAPLWEQCVKHNEQHYGQTFFCPEREQECISWLKQISNTTDLGYQQLAQRDVEFNVVTESKRIVKKQQEVPACRSICCTVVHYADYNERGDFYDEADRDPLISPHTCYGGAEDCFNASLLMCCPPLAIFCVCLAAGFAINDLCDPETESKRIEGMHGLAHAFCCVFPYCGVCKATKTIQYIEEEEKITGKHVKYPEELAHTLFGEVEAVRKKHAEVPVTPAPARMQMG